MKKTVLIFGASSFVGSNLAEALKPHFRVVGTYHRTVLDVPGITAVPCDVLKKDQVTRLVSVVKPHFCVYAVGQSSLSECKQNPKLAEALNSTGALSCANASERFGARFIYLSSGYVHGGENIVYREGDTPMPVTPYGSTLSTTEFYIQRSCLNYLILRCSPVYGRSFNPLRPTWFETLQRSLERHEPLEADDSVHTGHLDVAILARLLQTCLEANIMNKLLQVSSQDALTRYQFAQAYASVFRKDPSAIRPSRGGFPLTQGKKGADKEATFYYRLDTSNLATYLNVKIPTVAESLQFSQRRWSASAKSS